LAAGLVLKLVVFTEKIHAEAALEDTTTCMNIKQQVMTHNNTDITTQPHFLFTPDFLTQTKLSYIFHLNCNLMAVLVPPHI
jgi:hypothetical protein